MCSVRGWFVGFSVGQRALGSLSQLIFSDCLILKKVLGFFEKSAATYQSIKRNALAEADLQPIAVSLYVFFYYFYKFVYKYYSLKQFDLKQGSMQ